jgi:tRNA pseudouridine38-40 synthase
MARYQVVLSYDGTQFMGFQYQMDVRTVQGVVEKALFAVGWQDKAVLAAGRTDTGVHALGQVIAFDMDWAHGVHELQRALNANLPLDVAVSKVSVVNDNFHPRYDALARCYQYRMFCGDTRQPLKERYAWRVWPPVNVALMQKATRYLIGTHDFSAFGAPMKTGGSTIRTIFTAEWSQDGHDLVFEIKGNAFLYRMVRRIVFLLTKIGQRKFTHVEVKEKLRYCADRPVQGLAPSRGLYLTEVFYQE